MNFTKTLIEDAYKNSYAVPAINFESFEVLKGLSMGAAKCCAPIIVQTTEPALEEMGINNIVHMVNYYRDLFNISIGLHMDHSSNLDLVVKCIDAGYKSVMIDASEREFNENVKITKNVVEYAHSRGVFVEAEIGIVGVNGVNDIKTDFNVAKMYVENTSADALGISVGNSHGGKTKTRNIDFALLSTINNCLNIPLVLHGSSGILNHDLGKVMNYGICKVNIETELRVLYHNSLIEFLDKYPEEIKIRKLNSYLNEKIANFVVDKCKIFKCAGRN